MKIKARQMKSVKYGFTDDEKLILALRKDPVWACELLLNRKLKFFQRIVLRAMWAKPFILLLFGRGVGKTSLVVIYFLLKAMLYPGLKLGCLAPAYRQSLLMFDEVNREYWSKCEYLVACCPKPPSVSNTRAILRFSNGSYIEAIPLGNDGGKARGRRYDAVFIDEYADLSEQIINLVIRPFLNVKRGKQENQMIIASTARYKWNHFWDQYVFYRAKSGKLPELLRSWLKRRGFKEEPEKYDIFEFDLRDVNIDKSIPEFMISDEIIDNSYATMTIDEFAMENLNLFPDETSGFFSSFLIMDHSVSRSEEHQILLRAIDDVNSETKKPYDTFFVFGIDAARSDKPDAANFCLSIMRIKSLKNIIEKNLCKVVTTHGATFQEMVNIVRQSHVDFGLHRVRRIDVDQGGGGTTLRDLLAEKWTDSRTGIEYDPILEIDGARPEQFENTSSEFKVLYLQNQSDVFNNHMFNSLKADLEQNRLWLPITIKKDSDREIENAGVEIGLTKQELMVLETKPIHAGLKFVVPRGYQKDRAVALGLANNGSNILLGREGIVQEKTLAVGFWVR
jgi:hypothetical protein